MVSQPCLANPGFAKQHDDLEFTLAGPLKGTGQYGVLVFASDEGNRQLATFPMMSGSIAAAPFRWLVTNARGQSLCFC